MISIEVPGLLGTPEITRAVNHKKRQFGSSNYCRALFNNTADTTYQYELQCTRHKTTDTKNKNKNNHVLEITGFPTWSFAKSDFTHEITVYWRGITIGNSSVNPEVNAITKKATA